MPSTNPYMLVSTATLRGDGLRNQDSVVVTDRAAAVLDGASAWYPQAPGRDGGWYAENLGARLMNSLDEERPLADIVHDAIEDMCRTFGLEPGQSPESTVTIARWDAQHVEVYVLCDSPAVIFSPEADPVILLDERLQCAAVQARTIYRDYLRAGHGYGPELKPMLARLQEDERRERNREGGHWVAGAVPAAAHHALTAEYPLDQVAAVLLLSDGASAGVDEYGSPADWATARQSAITSPAQFIADVHRVEDSDPNGQRWPRAKCHDDKTIAVIQPLTAH
ncbi:hypothetical protein [Kineosporia babensis]|uniref:Protein phosphatase 2C-like protein n=1 Tax=Kineosporia babensis TaxID=499548 RepID=A0A9X1NE87_9ACTN|nr:hypothetical protein [Kineosporia babensis]MCD5311691.1 hypothetical protein [Kineosporia babensis]